MTAPAGRSLPSKLGLLIPRLGSNADGEVLATVAAIRRVLAGAGLDLHDLAAGVIGQQERGQDATTRSADRPADLALACLTSGRTWGSRESEFLGFVAGVRPRWAAMSERQVAWLLALHDAAEDAVGAKRRAA